MKTPDPGWQQLQRERFHLSRDYLFQPPPRVHRLNELMPEVLKDMGFESETRLAELTPVWESVVGKANAKHSRPGSWEKGCLTVYVDHNVWLAEMKRFGSGMILTRIRERFGEASVRQLKFVIDPGDAP